MGPELDPSWCGVLIHSAAQKLQFGTEIIFPYGPLAHLIAFVYTGELFAARVAWEFVSKTAFSAIVCAAIFALPKSWRPVFFLFVFLFIWIDPISDALYFVVLICLGASLFRGENGSRSLALLAGVVFGICSLIKFTYFFMALAAVLLPGAYLLIKRRRIEASILAGSFALSFLVSWLLAGQAFASLPSYLASSLSVSFGYKEAMAAPATSAWIVVLGVAVTLLGFIQCGLAFFDSPRRAPNLCVALFFAGAIFLSWTRAFVRADDHVLSFFATLPPACLAIWVATGPPAMTRRLAYVVNLLVLLLCLGGIISQRPAELTESLPGAGRRITGNVRVLTGFNEYLDKLRSALAQARAANVLPKVRAEVGDRTIDVFGYEQGIALLNDLHYTPRPVFQGYTASTARLIAANTAFYSSARAPTYVLFKYQPIDNRYPSLEDAGVLLQLLANYKPLFDERGYSLWKRVREPAPISPTPISSRSLVINEVCELPAQQNLWVELDLQKSLRGRLLNFFYKAPAIEIRTNDRNGRQFVHRLVPSMARAGFLINPELETARDVLESAIGDEATPVASFLVDIPRESRRFFQRTLSCRISAVPSWASESRDARSQKALRRALFREERSQADLATAFQASNEIVASRRLQGFAGFSALREATLTVANDRLEVLAEGTDPQLLFPRISLAPGKRGILRVDLEVPAETGVQLFFLPGGMSLYSSYYCLSQPVAAGKSSLYFELGDDALAGGPIRFDPGMAPGKYVITDFELRAVPPDSDTK